MRVVFLGTGDIGLPSFRWLLMVPEIEVVALITQPDKPAGRKMELTPPRIKTEALTYGIPVHQPVKLRAPEAVALVQSLEADVIVVMAYGQILPKAILEAPRLACLNLHASLLPRWRGASPIHAAIDAGDEKTGVTVMYMDVGLDTGDILLMREMVIQPDDTGGTLHDRMAEEAAGALAVSLAWLAAGQAPRVPQPAEGVTYAGKLTREHGELDFAAGRAAVDCRIRAMNPWPAAATTLPTPDGAKRLKIFAATMQAEPALPPGVAEATPEGLRIGTGDGSVLVTDLQLEGKKRLPAVEWLRGFTLAPQTPARRMSTLLQRSLDTHVERLRACVRCPKMHRPAVSGGAVFSKVISVGQAPGSKEPIVGRPFAWTAGKTLFGWFTKACGWSEADFRERIYMAAVARCFPGKTKAGGDRVPDPVEVATCSDWLSAEISLLEPALVIPIGKLAIQQFLEFDKLTDVIGEAMPVQRFGQTFDVIPLPHPSGASPWHRMEPGKTLLDRALRRIVNHPSWPALH